MVNDRVNGMVNVMVNHRAQGVNRRLKINKPIAEVYCNEHPKYIDLKTLL